jgi:hypothetical protein
MQRAQSATALDDFGDDPFREGLERLVESADREARLSERGRIGFDMQIADLLANRLQVEHWYRLHPEIDEQQIVAPLIGLGLPRTGSTALSCLLAEDPQVRSIRNWEASMPCPPPETATELSDPRIAIAHQMVLKRQQMFPRKMAMLPSSATMPTECQTYMGYDFKSHLFQALWQVPAYADWLNHEADLVPTYRYVKRVLKLLQWRCPPHRWRLKNPSHIVFIDALDQVFPDARYWMTHRDIGKVIPSVADLYHELIKASSDDVDKAYLGELNSHWCELGMRRSSRSATPATSRASSTSISRRSRKTRSRSSRSSIVFSAKRSRRKHGSECRPGAATRRATSMANIITTPRISASTPHNCASASAFIPSATALRFRLERRLEPGPFLPSSPRSGRS